MPRDQTRCYTHRPVEKYLEFLGCVHEGQVLPVSGGIPGLGASKLSKLLHARPGI